MDLEKLRKDLDASITFFHFKRARLLAKKGLKISKENRIKHLEYYFKAQVFIIAQKHDKALEYLDLCLKVKPQDVFALNDKGICLGELERFEEALICFNQAIRILPSYPGFYQNKGWLLALKGQYPKALLCFHKALEFDCRRPDSLFSIGYCYKNMEKVLKARNYYLKALRLVKGKSRFAHTQIEKALKDL